MQQSNFFHYRITFIHDGLYFIFKVRFLLRQAVVKIVKSDSQTNTPRMTNYHECKMISNQIRRTLDMMFDCFETKLRFEQHESNRGVIDMCTLCERQISNRHRSYLALHFTTKRVFSSNAQNIFA
ncbi:CLUMA_CG008448, isoform A [Clunio marinus]|uniref:CLUMA_CG008448, isoform A n=1 Tax=Clunio marinus TaxID=568069 RepID=A0A1J1I3S6_9DIPT|nr:CLUMA_CG008448, isoform A [Clunio marinus]